jgi:hypothetical protein
MREVTVANPAACRRRARQCKLIARAVRSDEVKQALLSIAKAWSKLAAEADPHEAQAPIDFLTIFRRTQFLKNG